MLLTPMRSPTLTPPRQASPLSTSTSPHPESPDTVELRQQVAGTILSVRPSNYPPTIKRPKLSLQTALPPIPTKQLRRPSLNLMTDTDSPTARNTVANVYEPPPPTPSSTVRAQGDFPIIPPSAPRAGLSSPFPHDEPYKLPIGTHSILRNSPLPPQQYSASSSRTPKRMLFPPVKRVMFEERAADIMPTPVIEIYEYDEEEEENPSSTEEERERKKAAIQAEDGHSGLSGRRSKRMREWIWRPMPEEIHESRDGTDTAAKELAEQRSSHSS